MNFTSTCQNHYSFLFHHDIFQINNIINANDIIFKFFRFSIAINFNSMKTFPGKKSTPCYFSLSIFLMIILLFIISKHFANNIRSVLVIIAWCFNRFFLYIRIFLLSFCRRSFKDWLKKFMDISWWTLLFTVVWVIHVWHVGHVVHIRRWICLWRLICLRHHVTRVMHWWRLLIHSSIWWNVWNIWNWWRHLLGRWVVLERSLFSFIRFFWRYWLTYKFLSFTCIPISLEHSFSMAEVSVLQYDLLIKQQSDFDSFVA